MTNREIVLKKINEYFGGLSNEQLAHYLVWSDEADIYKCEECTFKKECEECSDIVEFDCRKHITEWLGRDNLTFGELDLGERFFYNNEEYIKGFDNFAINTKGESKGILDGEVVERR